MASTPNTQSALFELPVPVAQALPWFTAEGERAWAPGWDPELLSGDGSRGSVFRTRNADGLVTTWIVIEYGVHAGIGRAAYARVAGGEHAGLVEVECRGSGVDRCTVEVRYTLTPLAPEFADKIAAFAAPAAYTAMIAQWGVWISAAIAAQAAADCSALPPGRLHVLVT